MQEPTKEGNNEFHVMPDTETDTKEHKPSEHCWCGPMLIPYDPETEHAVWVHKYLN